jgi:hypothetical protein
VEEMRKYVVLTTALAVLSLVVVCPVMAQGGFDFYGYNYQARVFEGPADCIDRDRDGTVWGDPTYANDHLVMKWSKAWDDARFHGAAWTPDAWVSNEWNGRIYGGSGVSETVKVVWVGPELESSPYWRDGGYPIWGEFEVIFDHYLGRGGSWPAHATPAGLGTE